MLRFWGGMYSSNSGVYFTCKESTVQFHVTTFQVIGCHSLSWLPKWTEQMWSLNFFFHPNIPDDWARDMAHGVTKSWKRLRD